MKSNFILGFALSILFSAQPIFALGTICEDAFKSDESAQIRSNFAESVTSPKAGLTYSDVVDVSKFTGITFLTLMKEQIKPELDSFAQKGFTIASAEDITAALNKVSSKVMNQALKAAGGAENLDQVAKALQGKNANLYTLPGMIADTKVKVDRYGLSTFIALASGGGVEVKLNSQDCCFNVNYGTGTQAKDEMTGRSFGQRTEHLADDTSEGTEHLADDASDKSYLQSLQNYFKSAGENVDDFYKTLLMIIANSDPSNLTKVSGAGQSVLSDFTAIYVAEQDRHLMSGMKTHAWDVALLEVTLLSSFHAGQSKFMVMFDGKLVDKLPKQAPGGSPRTNMKDADMTDWWQFSSNPDPASRNRSGINTTKKDFRTLETVISDFMRTNHPELVQNVERHFKGSAPGGNLYAKLTDFLINAQAPRSLADAEQLATDFSAFLSMVRKEADKITQARLAFQNQI